ncbi:MAG TPA: hypothetical protein VK437_14640 [Steroidobacteraceae bacterium]|nr:hypothetical protein [Steroidobacteraceae bacterium]
MLKLERHEGPVARRQTDAGQRFALRGFVQAFGLDPRAALLTLMVDLMANSATIVSAGILYEVELGAAVVLGYIVYRIQKAWYGDDHDSALIKALTIALLTAIPAPITALLAVPGGALGLLGRSRGGG